jgi:hypothetical protein
MVFMAMRKPHSCPRWRSPRSGGPLRDLHGRLLRAADLWKPATFWKAADSSPRKGWQVDPISWKYDRVAAADGPAIDNRGVDADVYCVVLSSRAEDS